MEWLNWDVEQTEMSDVWNMGSLNHSAIQANLSFLLKRVGKYSVFTELSLDLSQLDASLRTTINSNEIKPDVCIYPKRPLNLVKDVLRIAEAPLLVIEILSPLQGTQVLLDKFSVYFALGIQSCWLVIPANRSVTVYHALDNFRAYSEQILTDTKLALELNLDEIFD